MGRLTYRSSMGDYGSNVDYVDEKNGSYDIHKEVHALRNKLGRYEDLGYEPEKLFEIIKLYEASQFKWQS